MIDLMEFQRHSQNICDITPRATCFGIWSGAKHVNLVDLKEKKTETENEAWPELQIRRRYIRERTFQDWVTYLLSISESPWVEK